MLMTKNNLTVINQKYWKNLMMWSFDGLKIQNFEFSFKDIQMLATLTKETEFIKINVMTWNIDTWK